MTIHNKNRTSLRQSTQWNLQLLYQSPDDPQIQQDLEDYNTKRAAFAKKYQERTDFLKEEELLYQALTDYEQLINELNGARPLMYFHYLTAIRSDNTQAHAQLNKITNQLTKAHNELTFFPIKLGKIDLALQTKFLHSPKLARYQYFLSRRFESARYDLNEEQEKILNLTDQTSFQMWVEGVNKAINKLTVAWKGKSLPISEAAQKIAELPTKPRRELHQKMLKKLSCVKEFAEAEINAVVTSKYIEDDLRGFKQPYQARFLAAQNDPDTVRLLIDTVSQNYQLAHRFYQAKTKLLKLPELTYADRNAKIGLSQDKKTYSFVEAKEIVMQTFHDLDPKFANIFERMLDHGQLDIFPRKNKLGGAFCSSSLNNPTFVLLNHTDNLESVTTLAHEMGHAIHSELSKQQPAIYQNYSTSLAETASTFFEQFVFDRLVKNFSKKEQVIALHNKIQDEINTVFRQVALFQFEEELHAQIKETGYLDYNQIGFLLSKHMQNYMGKGVKISKQDGRFFIFWPHIRMFFYTYTYAFGHLVSNALADQVRDNPKQISAVIKLLSAGGKAKPKDILLDANINLSKPDFFQKGVKVIEREIDELESLMK